MFSFCSPTPFVRTNADGLMEQWYTNERTVTVVAVGVVEVIRKIVVENYGLERNEATAAKSNAAEHVARAKCVYICWLG